MTARNRRREHLHPATFGGVLLILVAVGRLPELIPALGVLQLGNVAVVLGAIGLFMGRWSEDVPVFGTSTGRLIILFAVLGGLSVAFSVWNTRSLEVFLNGMVTNVVLFYLVARSANSPRMLHVYAGAIAASAALLAAEAVIGYSAGRVQVGTAYDANDLAMVLVTILPLVAGGILSRGGMRRGILVVVAALMLLTILLTGSRGGILGLIAVVAFLLFARFPRTSARRQPRRLGFGKLLVIGAGGVLLVAAMPQLTWERMASLANYQSDYNVTSEFGRLAIWGRGLDAFAERPWGYGIGTFENVEWSSGGHFKAAHNIWIEIGVELGLPGLVLLFGLFWVAARTAARLSARAFAEIDGGGRDVPAETVQLATLGVAMKGSLIGFLVTSFFLSVAFTGVLYALLALTASMEHHERALADKQEGRGGVGAAFGRRQRRREAFGGAAFSGSGRTHKGRQWTR